MRMTLSLACSVLALATCAFAVDITAPGQTVVDGEVGVLVADLTCSPPNALYLGDRTRLDLNGHVLDGCYLFATGFEGDVRRISVRGPGEIRNAGIHLSEGSVRVSDVAIHDAPDYGIRGDNGSTIRVSNVTITNSGRGGIWGTRVIARTLTVTGSGHSGTPGSGIVGFGGVNGRYMTVADNLGDGVYAAAGNTVVRKSQITGNAGNGVIGFKVAIIGSNVTGNATDPDTINVDLLSSVRPRVIASTCGTSLSQNQTTWGVCAND